MPWMHAMDECMHDMDECMHAMDGSMDEWIDR